MVVATFRIRYFKYNIDGEDKMEFVNFFRELFADKAADVADAILNKKVLKDSDIEKMIAASFSSMREGNAAVEGDMADAESAEANGVTMQRKIADKKVENVILKDETNKKLPASRKEAFDYIPASGVLFYNKSIGSKVKVSRNTVKHTSLHNNIDKYAIFAGIEEIINNAEK